MSSGGAEPGLLVDLGLLVSAEGADGALWSLPHGGDLDANLVRLSAGAEIGEHRNDEVDVLLSVLAGSGTLVVDGVVHDLTAGHLALVARGGRRAVRAAAEGIVYLSIHRSRSGLSIGPRRAR